MPGDNREEYLEAVYGILEDGKTASTGELSRALGVKAGSVTEMLKKLRADGLIRYEPYRGVELTERGLEVASGVKRKHRLLERFLHDILGIRKSRIHDEACRMEHGLSDEAADALDRLLKHPKDCPDDHKPIPARLGGASAARTLADLGEGGVAFVEAVSGGESLKARLHSMGVCEGKRLRVVAVEPFGGPVVVKVGNTSLTIGRGMASKVRVTP
jgi:DtxR family transcriptional regulator, Mn-dependent transcriptional regulator